MELDAAPSHAERRSARQVGASFDSALSKLPELPSSARPGPFDIAQGRLARAAVPTWALRESRVSLTSVGNRVMGTPDRHCPYVRRDDAGETVFAHALFFGLANLR